jgi:hypothetical protein
MWAVAPGSPRSRGLEAGPLAGQTKGNEDDAKSVANETVGKFLTHGFLKALERRLASSIIRYLKNCSIRLLDLSLESWLATSVIRYLAKSWPIQADYAGPLCATTVVSR